MPHSPAARVIDVARVLVASRPVEIRVQGIRPGEKMHECLISRNELCRTFDYGDHFIVTPLVANRDHGQVKNPVEPYTSDKAEMLSDKEIRKLIGESSDSGSYDA